MSTYATPQALLDRFSAEEIAQRADRGTPRLVTAALLTTAVAGGDLSGYTAPEQAAVAAALTQIAWALSDADDAIDGWLAVRYAVPIVSPPHMLVRVACDMARYYLYDDQVTEVIQKRYDAAERLCRDLASGKLSLGSAVDAFSPATGAVAEISSDGSVFHRTKRGGL